MDKQHAILEAALKLFAENGFHGTPTGTIAKEAGVANGTLFHHFKTKEELIAALYRKLRTELAGNAVKDIGNAINFRMKFEGFWNNVIFWGLENPLKIRFIQQYLYSPYSSGLYTAEEDRFLPEYSAIIDEGLQKEELKQLPKELIYTLGTQQMLGMIQYLDVNKGKINTKKFISQSFTLFWESVRKSDNL